ncbi:MAG: cobalamin biosynthesis protein CobD [Ardenticatenia bacterium]|nr:cobalamin biosynthesis protein CobD [Ardenticatenia bacterium]
MPWWVITLLGALALDLALGEPPNAFHPVAWMGRFIGWGWRRSPRRGPLRQFAWGAALVLAGTALFSLPWALLDIPLRWLWSIPLLKLTFSIRALFQAGREVQEALERGDLSEARRLVGWHLVSRDTSQLSSSLVVAATVESLAENITDGLTSPLLFFALGGLPGAWAYRFCNTCDSTLGYRDPEREYLGKFAARLDDVLNWLPARLTGALMVLAAMLSGEDAGGAWRTMLAQHGRTASPNAGWTMSAIAGALEVTLEKVGHYRLEGGDGPLDAGTIERCFRVVRWTMALVVCCVILLMGVLHVCFA